MGKAVLDDLVPALDLVEKLREEPLRALLWDPIVDGRLNFVAKLQGFHSVNEYLDRS